MLYFRSWKLTKLLFEDLIESKKGLIDTGKDKFQTENSTINEEMSWILGNFGLQLGLNNT